MELPINITDFRTVRNNQYYYVDKTMIIKELSEKKKGTNLFTRPRRFGKTLTLNMMKTFYEQEIDRDGNTVGNSRYFEGLKIMDAGEKYLDDMGQYPVIWMTLKSAKRPEYGLALWMLKKQIWEEFSKYKRDLRKR